MYKSIIKKASALLLSISLLAGTAAVLPYEATQTVYAAESVSEESFEYNFTMGGSQYIREQIAEKYGEDFVVFYDDIIAGLAEATVSENDLGETVSLVYTKNDGIEPKGITKSIVIELFQAIIYDNPQFYWITGTGLTFPQSEGAGKYTLRFAVNSNYRSAEARRNVNNAIKSEIEGYAEMLGSKKNTFFKLAALNDVLAENTKYDVNKEDDDRANIVGCLKDHLCVCDGYSKSFMLISNALGIADSVKATTYAHAWNAVNFDGSWYFIDVTFNDVILNGSVDNDNHEYWRRYFLKSYETFIETDYENHSNQSGYVSDHADVEKLYSVFDLPAISEDDYVYTEKIDLSIPSELEGTVCTMTAKSLDTFNPTRKFTLNDQSFNVEALNDGTYTLTFSAPNCVSKEYTVTLYKGAPTEPLEVQLNALGDATLDGSINTLDIMAMKSDMIGIRKLSDYAKLCANVEGNNQKIDTLDILFLKRHLIHYKSIWN